MSWDIVNSLLDLMRLVICLIFLSIASIYDIKFREVPNLLWIIFAPLGLALSLTSLILNIYDRLLVFTWIVILIIMSSLSLALFYFGLMGGADSKALICLALSAPARLDVSVIRPVLRSRLQQFFPILVSISTFNNAVLIASLLTIIIALRNLIDLIRSSDGLFKGLEGESFLKKALAFMIGYRVDARKLRSRRHYYISMEEFSLERNGSIKRHLKIFRPMNASGEVKVWVPEDFEGKIWVTPGLPFLLFIEAGFIMTMLLGDIIMWLVANLLGAL